MDVVRDVVFTGWPLQMFIFQIEISFGLSASPPPFLREESEMAVLFVFCVNANGRGTSGGLD